MKENSGWQTRFLLAFFGLVGVAAVLWAIARYAGAPIPALVLTIVRWASLLSFCGYAWARRSLTAWIVAGMLIGAEIGYDWPNAGANMKVLSLIFLRLIKTIVAPLVFATLVVGIAGHSNLKQVGRMGIKALIYFEIVTTIALLIGVGAINLSKAGVGVQQPPDVQTVAAQKQTASGVIEHIFPENIAKSVAEGQVLQVVVFSIIFGIALAMLSDAKRRPMLSFCESLSEVMFKFTNIVMWFAPIGVCGAIAYTVGTMGFGILRNLAQLLVTFYAALFAFILLVFVPVALIARIPLRRFMRAVAEPASIAFATASSEAALPRGMEAMEAFGAPRQTVAFVMPLGYSFNLDGSTLYLALAAIFVAQATGKHLSLVDQLLMIFTFMLISKGIAGIPRATLVVLLGALDSFQLQAWPVFVILGIDQLLDMGRTALNVVGNCLATVVIARWEGELGEEAPSSTVMDAVAR
jgi:proton glutamate symport protein